ncbi:hypothetical protein WJX79_009825 [Trebouxia sp. C0005]
MTMLSVDVTDAAIASAFLAAGAAVLPATGAGSNKRAPCWDRGRAAPLFRAVAPAAHTLGQAFSRRPASGVSAPSQRAAAPSQLTLPESVPAAELPQHVMESNWEDEEGEYPAPPQLTDTQWARVAKLIEDQPCQVRSPLISHCVLLWLGNARILLPVSHLGMFIRQPSM